MRAVLFVAVRRVRIGARCARPRFAGGVAVAFAREAQAPPKVDFARDVQPIFRQHCVECHGPSQQMRGLRLDRRRDAMPNRVGANGSRIVPGNSSASPVYRRLTGEGGVAQMPPQSPLSAEQISLIKTWIDQGADWPDALSGDVVSSPPDPAVVRMMHALRDGDRQQFARTLREAPASVNAKGHGGWTPLMYAALYGDAEAVRLLLAARANPNAANDERRHRADVCARRRGENAPAARCRRRSQRSIG